MSAYRGLSGDQRSSLQTERPRAHCLAGARAQNEPPEAEPALRECATASVAPEVVVTAIVVRRQPGKG